MNQGIKIILGVTIGAVLGSLLGFYGKCAGGVCPLTSNPFSGAISGAIIGLLFVLIR